MLIEGILGGGSQSGSPSQSSPSSGSSGAAQDDAATGGNNTAPASGSQSDTVENYSPEETDDGTYGPTPPAEASTDDPVDQVAEYDVPAASDSDAPADEVADEQPASAEPSALAEPETGAPASQTDGSGPANAPAATAGARDFVTPLLANLHAISQRSAARATDDVSASQRRAAANVHDQMIRQMLDQMSAKGASGSSTQLFKSEDNEPAQSLPARWYAEA